MEDVKEEEKLLKDDKQTFLKAVKKLRLDRDKMRDDMIELSHHKGTLENLQRQGFIDAHGAPVTKKN